MPATINGIGTRYYGQCNVVTRAGTCGYCQNDGYLTSYDTRLWVTVFFIPIIPLGRKRIIEYCPRCTRHIPMGAKQYETLQQEQVAAALAKYEEAPSPESAMSAHAALMYYHQFERAAQFREHALPAHSEHATLRVVLASHLAQSGRPDEAGELYAEAYRLDPESLEARVGLANRCMSEGELGAARQLLEPLEAPGTGRTVALGPLDRLAHCYQRAGQHQEALELAHCLLREFPQVGKRRDFRKFVSASEKALGEPQSMLPPRSRAGILLGISAVAGVLLLVLGVVGAVAGSNEYIRRHRTLHVVNACGTTANVSIDDGPPTKVDSIARITLPEGRHKIHVTGPCDDTQQYDFKTDYFDRWLSKPAWVLNVGGEAALLDQTIHYAVNPRPADVEVLVGEKLLFREHVDYPFETAPDQVNLNHKQQEVDKRVLVLWQEQDAVVFQTAAQTQPLAALAFAEARLTRNPHDSALLEAYLEQVQMSDTARAEQFLHSGLERLPVEVEWHRFYQTYAELNGHSDEMHAYYDARLADAPDDARLLYLLGRIEDDAERSRSLFERSIAADDTLGWPWLALAYRNATEANWDESLDQLQQAESRSVPARYLDEPIQTARIGSGATSQIISGARARLEQDPQDYFAIMNLCEALVIDDKPGGAENECHEWAQALPPEMQGAGEMIGALTAYMHGDYGSCLEHAALSYADVQPAMQAHCLLAQGKPGEAAADPLLEGVWEDPSKALQLALAFLVAGDAESAQRWREHACSRFESAGLGKIAACLRSPRPPSVEEVRKLDLDVGEQMLLLTALAWMHDDARWDYLPLAEKLNVRRGPPYQLVKRAIEAASAKPPL